MGELNYVKFAVADIVEIFSDATSASYLKKMRRRDSELNSKWGTICTPPAMVVTEKKLEEKEKAIRVHEVCIF